MRRRVVVSVETTDLTVNGGTPVDLTLMVLNWNLEVVLEYSAYIIPETPLSEGAVNSHSMDMEWLRRYGRPSYTVFAEVWQFLAQATDGGPLSILGNDVGFQYQALQNWFIHHGYPDSLKNFLTPTGSDIEMIAQYLNEVYEYAGGLDACLFTDFRTGKPSVSVHAQCKALGVDLKNRDARPSRSKALTILDIYKSHISSVGEDFKTVMDGVTVETDTFSDNPHCSKCGAVAEVDSSYVYEGALKLDCVLCGTSNIVQEIK